MEVKVKLMNGAARVPTYGTPGAAAFDLYATKGEVVMPGQAETFGTGIAVEMEPGHVLMIYSRSGHGFNHGVRLGNAVAVIDQDYRNEIFIRLHNDGSEPFTVKMGNRIAQGIVQCVQRVSFTLTDELSETARGMNGLGSTGA